MMLTGSDNLLFISYKFNEHYLINPNIYFSELSSLAASSAFIDYIDLYIKKGPKKTERHILKTIEEKNIRYVLFCAASADVTFDISFFKQVHQKAKLILFFLDTPSYFGSLDGYYAQTSDLVMVFDRCHAVKYQALEIPVLDNCMAVPKEKIVFIEPGKYEYDISFVGNTGVKNNRKKYIDVLNKNNLHPTTFGIHTDSGFINENEMTDVFRKSKINLNFSGIQYSNNSLLRNNILNRKREVKARLFEITACGGFALSEYYPGIEHHFEPGKEIAVFYNENDLLEKIQFYLQNETLRKQIAYNGFLRLQQTYSSDVAAKRVWESIKNISSSPTVTAYTDKIYRKAYTNFRMRYLVIFFFKFKPGYFFTEFMKIFKYRAFSFRFAYFYFIDGIYMLLASRPNFRRRLIKISSNKLFAFLTFQKITK